MSNMGYPGVPGSPTNPGPREKSTPVKVVGEDAVNALVRHPNGDIEIVNKDRLRRG